MSERKEDLRIVKTRAALSSAFFDLLTTMEISEITVNKLCEHSGVRRATFYKHFRDKDDFIIFIIKDVRNHFDSHIWNKEANHPITKEYYYQYAEALLAFLLRHEAAMKRIATAPVRSTFITVFLHQNYEDTKQRLEDSVKTGMRLLASPDVVASMLIGGIAQCIVHWFEDDDRCSPEILLKDIIAFTERVLS
jgi:AcrR family transcriptional regulator